ncbi:MAG: protein tyrosine phosphatase [Ferruginibacter sp.]|nr:protein tyrosine phosphatase [Ferruginibacter sp.]
MNILFVCSKNLSRSPTAEMIYKDHDDINVKSAGTEPSAENKLTAENISWSDLIFVMEKKHEQTILENFPIETKQKQIIVLDIGDEYKYMDDELIDKVKAKVSVYLDK